MKKPILLSFMAAILISACGAVDEHAPEAETALVELYFQAEISGGIAGKVDGAGVINFLEGAGYDQQGYYFLADGTGIRNFGITFTLPKNVSSGRIELQSPNPFDAGKVTSVRVDHDLGDQTVSWEKNTVGVLVLTAFPEDDTDDLVSGNFDFSTENGDGERIAVKGSFSFKANSKK